MSSAMSLSMLGVIVASSLQAQGRMRKMMGTKAMHYPKDGSPGESELRA